MPGTNFRRFSSLSANIAVGVEIPPNDLDVDGSGQAEIQNLADDVRGQEVKSDARKILGQFDAQIVDVFGGGMMILGQLDQDVGVAGADGRGIAVGKIDAAVGQPDVVDDADEFGLRNLLADDRFHAGRKARRFLRCACRWERACAV